MKTSIIILIFSILIFSSLSFALVSAAVSLPDEIPNIITQTAQKDKASVVLINSIITGTVLMPSYEMSFTGSTTDDSGSIVGTWQAEGETLTFTSSGEFDGDSNYGYFSGTYSTQGNTLSLHYMYPYTIFAQFTYSISGDSMVLSSAMYGTATYTRIGSTTSYASEVLTAAENMVLIREEGTSATVLTESVANGASGTGFIISPDGYLITNAHVVLADDDETTMLVDAFAYILSNALYEEFSKYYNIPQDEKEQIVSVMLQKFMDYFYENGELTNVNTDYYVFSGDATPGENLQLKSWPAVVKKEGNVHEKISGEWTWGRDIAVLKVEKTGLPTVVLGDSDKVQVGDDIFVIGYPGKADDVIFTPETKLEATVSTGVVSAKKTLRNGIETFQTDASIMGGNSGGPAYNKKGEVIGIATFGGTEGSGVNFLLPINLAKQFMKELNVDNEHSIIDTKYSEALSAFWSKDCYTTNTRMKEVLTLYPDHPFAQDYIDECDRAILTGEAGGPALDMGVVFIIAGVAVCLVVVFLIKKGIIPIKIKLGK
ncbi:MAG: trypsin-like peptidase domain-containing protein [Nanoarchaeota archaeon]|nr:trypsin-like peptidase domain-containing protein [Nanoarchaeota archaeon]MBU1135573.1 trypsin-like peptidase domain-containing protein [Nanoarchaeota archaeon]